MQMLVYEFMAGGTLRDHLNRKFLVPCLIGYNANKFPGNYRAGVMLVLCRRSGSSLISMDGSWLCTERFFG